MSKGKYGFEVTNKNEITKSEFDQLNKVRDFDIFTPRHVTCAMASIQSLIRKGEVQELSQEELDMVKSATAELENLEKYTINEMVNGRIVKSDVYVQEKQVVWEDTLEKSLYGSTIKKGVYLDTDLNRKLDRVGDIIIKGKKVDNGKKADMSEEEERDMKESEMYKAMMDMVKKGDGTDKKAVCKAMKEKYPDADDKMVKKYMNAMYKAVSDVYMKKAGDYAKMSEEEEDEAEEEGDK